jgi:hypothetical protein
MAMFDNRLNLSVNGFVNKNRDMFTEKIVPTGSNFSNTILATEVIFDNKGVELRADASLFSRKKVEWKGIH